jgi:hypothetical protein
VFEQDFYRVDMAVVSGQHQQGVALVLRRFGGKPLVSSAAISITFARLVENLFGKFGSFFRGHLAALSDMGNSTFGYSQSRQFPERRYCHFFFLKQGHRHNQ